MDELVCEEIPLEYIIPPETEYPEYDVIVKYSNAEVHELILIQQKDQDQIPPHVDTFNEICRICLIPFNQQEESFNFTLMSRNINDRESHMHIRSLIEVYTYVKIPETEDNLPQNICEQCLEFLINMHIFRSRCRINNDLLMRIYCDAINQDNQPDVDLSLIPDETSTLIKQINDARLKVFRCKDCDSVFNMKKEMIAHRQALCGKPKLKSEMLAIVLKTPEVTGITDEILQQGDDSFDIIEPRDKKPVCPHCKFVCQSDKRLLAHINAYHITYTCPDCAKTFNRPNALKVHLRTHTKEKPYVCDICNKGFSQASTLHVHRHMHESESSESKMKHKCKMCNSEFDEASALKSHALMHKDKKQNSKAPDKSFQEDIQIENVGEPVNNEDTAQSVNAVNNVNDEPSDDILDKPVVPQDKSAKKNVKKRKHQKVEDGIYLDHAYMKRRCKLPKDVSGLNNESSDKIADVFDVNQLQWLLGDSLQW